MISNNRPILLLAETGFIIRNLLLGYFADEVSKGRRLIVAVPNSLDKKLNELIMGKNIELVNFPMSTYKDNRSRLKRLLSWDNIYYNTKLAIKNNASINLQTRLFEGTKQKKEVERIFNYSCYIFGKFLKYTRLIYLFDCIYLKIYISKKSITKEWNNLLLEINPEIVFSTMLTHSVRYKCSSDLPVLVASKKLGIKTCALVQSWDNISSKTSILPGWVDKYYTWSESMSVELLEYNPQIDSKKVDIVGSPQFDFHRNEDLLEQREKYLKSIGLDPRYPFILIGTGTATWMPDEMEKMISLCGKINDEIKDIQTLIRLHPKDHGERWLPFRAAMRENNIIIQYSSPQLHMDEGGFIPPVEFYKDQINTIYHAAAVINSASTLTIDTAILDKPIICIAYDQNKDAIFPEGRALMYSQSVHYSKLVKTGGVSIVYSEDECIKEIIKYLKNPELLSRERKKIVDLVAGDTNKKAGLKLANRLLDLLDK